jgi:hypothetical protein
MIEGTRAIQEGSGSIHGGILLLGCGVIPFVEIETFFGNLLHTNG